MSCVARCRGKLCLITAGACFRCVSIIHNLFIMDDLNDPKLNRPQLTDTYMLLPNNTYNNQHHYYHQNRVSDITYAFSLFLLC